MLYVFATGLTLLNLVFLASILLGLPGTWLMILAALLVDWLQSGEPMFTPIVLYASVALAVVGELAEFAFGAAGARRAGGSKRGASLAIVGGIIGAIIGTAIPVPVLGTLFGACIGAFVGSVSGDMWAGRSVDHSVEAGRGAATGRLWGTIVKLGLGSVIFVLLAVAAYR